MNIEDYRDYCLSLDDKIEEKLPFQKFKSGEGVLVFYVMDHMFSFFDCNDYSVISLKCQPERIDELKLSMSVSATHTTNRPSIGLASIHKQHPTTC